MKQITRRNLLISGMAATAAGLTDLSLARAEHTEPTQPTPEWAPGAATSAPGLPTPVSRERLSLDDNWMFALGNGADPRKDFGYGADARERTFAKSGRGIADILGEKIDLAHWMPVTLPHDWALDLPFVSQVPLPEQGGKEIGRSHPATSVGWYHRVFTLPRTDEGKRIVLEFDGVMRAAQVFFNGHYIGDNFSGYAPFSFDVTDWANFGSGNNLVVRCDVSFGEGWFYEGAGIYRHVWLTKTAPLHLAQWETVIRSDATKTSSNVALSSGVTNESEQAQNCAVVWQIYPLAAGSEGRKPVAAVKSPFREIAPGESTTFEALTSVTSPQLWSCETPNMYVAVASLVSQTGTVIDSLTEHFGIRSIRFDADKGFLLNGKSVKIKGTCNHQDHAGLGVALPDRMQTYRLERLLAMGSNAYRTSHNPPTPELLDATDRLGVLVMCETRMMDASTEGLSQLARMIRRFRNHPSIVIWSLGNEEPEQGTPRGARIATTMKREARRLDPTRPVTIAMNGEQGKGVSAVVDVQGFNYAEPKIDAFHHTFPKQPVIGTETASTLCTRGIYHDDTKAGYKSAYDIAANIPKWGATAEKWWNFYIDRPFLAGGFAWTGFDYRGEPTPYHWPCISSHFGIMDTCGFPKDNFFYYRSWWQKEPVLHLFPHWNWEGQDIDTIPVWVHSNLDSVELFLNGTSLGSKPVVPNSHLEWSVKYAKGVIEARGTKDGKVVSTEKRETTGAPAKLHLSADRSALHADGEDVAVLTVEVQDADGRIVPTSGNLAHFTLTGPGQLIGVGNGDPSCHESDRGEGGKATRSAFNGLCMAIVQTGKVPGDIQVQVSADGLKPATLTLTSTSVALRPAVA
jgi:beta-galactosidase